MLSNLQCRGTVWIASPIMLTLVLLFLLMGAEGKRTDAGDDALVAEEGKTTGSESDGASAAPDDEETTTGDGNTRGGPTVAAIDSGPKLYARHCAGCHGERGDGQGIAAPYLYPKPRDFRAGRFRLVSTVNRTPSRDDLLNVLRRGMPGSSMPPWDQLNSAELDLLVGEVQRLHREGASDQYIRVLKESEGFTDDEIADPEIQEEIARFVQQRTTAGETTEVPPIAEPDDDALARGKELYMGKTCNQCHGDSGRGDGGQKMVDDEGFPMTPRDFTAGIFKGGHDPASIYRRIAYGMPGTPMPSSQLTPAEIIDLSHYVLSLSDEQTRQAALQRRQKITAARVADVPADATDDAWTSVESTRMRMVPLWWRNDAHPDVDVKAVHDGQTIALLISWPDETPNWHAVTSATFEDALAVELYTGPKETEPFLGMGGPKSPVDLWFWDADRQTAWTVEEKYPNVVVDIFPFDEKESDTAEGDRPGAKTEAQPPISLPAVASGNPIVPIGNDSGFGGSALVAGGPQTVTFRIPKNESVDARGTWADGRWTVEMKRPLDAPPESGVSLAAGGRASIGFAVWNGAKNDRDGQKLITIWNDLVIER